MFKEDEVYKDTLVQQVTDKGKNSKVSEKQKKKAGKKVSFSSSLVHGPSSPDYEHGETSGSGNSEDQEGSEESECDEETEGIVFAEVTKTTKSVDNYMLARLGS